MRPSWRVWIVTGSETVGFYRACGWADCSTLVTRTEGLPSTVLACDLAQ